MKVNGANLELLEYVLFQKYNQINRQIKIIVLW